MARKGRQEWEEHLCHVLLTKPAVVVQEAYPMLEEHGCCLKELKSEFYCSNTLCSKYGIASLTVAHAHTN